LLQLSFSEKKSHSLTIHVKGLRNSDGVVLFLLYDKEGSIPDKHKTKYLIKRSSRIALNKASYTFSNLPANKYAVNIIHDENNNGEIDMGFMLPKEGIGFSNFKKLNILNRPNFTYASFELSSDIVIDINTIYM
jgi:uncharacterized protein (DUF2141 family)